MIVLASIPRCGSTWLFRSLCGFGQGGDTPPGSQGEHGIVKTHRMPEHEPRLEGFDPAAGDRALFLWGDVAAAVESTRQHRRSEGHFRNCADGHPGEAWPPEVDVRSADTFGYEAIWDGWGDAPFPVLWIRYGALRGREARRAVEDWLGRDVDWLPWRDRRTVLDTETRRWIETAYRSLLAKAEEAPDVAVRSAVA